MENTITKTEKKSLAQIIAKAIRIITVPPLMALVAFLSFIAVDDFYTNLWECAAAVCFIAVFPLLAYPLSVVIPAFKGREGQRNLAFIMCNVGYIFGVIYAIAFSAGKPVTVMLITYLFSGSTLLIVNKLFRFKASGHGCGLAGPLAALGYFISPWLLILGLGLFILALWSSLYLRRHTLPQFVVGSLIPVAWLIMIGSLML